MSHSDASGVDASGTGASGILDPADPRADVQRALRDWLDLQAAFAWQPQRVAPLLVSGAPPRAALVRAGGVLRGERERDAAVAALRDCGAVAVPLGAPAYPPALTTLVDAPPLLLVRGDPAALGRPGVAIVGSRAATAYGRSLARLFASALAGAGFSIVSGLATGIDAEAHAAALASGGDTLALMACGPERIYPGRHRELARRVQAAGALVTEFPSGAPPRGAHFPLRNRLISRLSRAVLVVEGRLRSGSLVTARHAADQGVDVWAVPGPIDTPGSSGTNALIRDGCRVALSPTEMLECLAPGLARAPRPPRPRAVEGLAPDSERVLRALRDAPRARDELVRALDLPPAQLAAALLELELAGLVLEDRDGRLRSSPRGLS